MQSDVDLLVKKLDPGWRGVELLACPRMCVVGDRLFCGFDRKFCRLVLIGDRLFCGFDNNF